MGKNMGRSGARPNNRLRQERLRRNWSQNYVAEKLGTTKVTISRWERGSQQPNITSRQELCKLFGMSAEELGLLPADPHPQVPEETKDPTPVDPPDDSTQPDEAPSTNQHP